MIRIRCFNFLLVTPRREHQQRKIHIGTFQNKEVDFVCTRSDEKIYVQVTYLLADKTTKKREVGNLELMYDNHPKFVVSMDEHASGNVTESNMFM